MANTVLKADLRDKAGKGSSRALRREDKVPAVIYGDKKEPVMITLGYVDLWKELNKGGFLNTTFDLEVGGKKENVLPRDLQFHPVTDKVLHVDFLRLAKGATINLMIPVHFSGDEESPGIKGGGILNVVRHEIEFSCPVSAIPEAINIDISELDLNDSVHISDITLPKGVIPVIDDRDFTIATIAAPSALKSEEEEEAEAAEAEAAEAEAAEGEASEGSEE